MHSKKMLTSPSKGTKIPIYNQKILHFQNTDYDELLKKHLASASCR